jgi:hypothetical protein
MITHLGVPSCLGPPISFDAQYSAAAAAVLPPKGGQGPGAVAITFAIQNQRLDNWCWAAVAASVAGFFTPGNPWTQCKIASTLLNASCCSDPAPNPPCNDTFYLDRALQLVGHLGSTMKSGAANLSELQTQISNSRPLCAYIDWGNGGDGHFITVSGYDLATAEVRADDPDGATQTWMSYTKACNAYPGGGSWNYSYWTS